MFYIMAGNDELYAKRSAIYDFKEHTIHVDFQERADFSQGLRSLIFLGFNLYNGFHSNENSFSPMDLINTLDQANFNLAINALHLRRGKTREEDARVRKSCFISSKN